MIGRPITRSVAPARFLRRADHAIQLAGPGQARQTQHLVGRRIGHADLGQILGAHAGQYRHGNQQRPLREARQRVLRRRHHAASARCMDVQHPHTQFRCRLAGRRHGIGDVVEFQVKEYIEPARHQRTHQLRSRHGEQLLAHLEPA